MIHSLKYSFKTIIKNRSLLIWTIAFPIVLATFMYVAFGNIYQEDMVFNTIKVDIVEKHELVGFNDMIEELSKGDKPILEAAYTDEEQAKEDLRNGEIEAIIYESASVRMVVTENDFSQQLLKSILDTYLKKVTITIDVAITSKLDFKDGDAIKAAVMSDDATYFSEVSTTKGNQDPYIAYFYAILAMSCLFSSFAMIEIVSKIQANLSPLGMRRSVSSTKRGTMILSEFITMWLITFIIEILSYGYMRMIGVKFSTDILPVFGILFVGSGFGISMGVLIGCIPKMSVGSKSGMAVAISMAMSVMSDLCAQGVKNLIEHSCPIINRLNPAAIITDSFYALSVFDNYDRYLFNMASLGGMTAILLIISIMLLGRTKNASL